MSNNCLVTQLKAEVQNDNLPYFGKIAVKYGVWEQASLNNRTLVLRVSKNTTINIAGGVFCKSDHVTPIDSEVKDVLELTANTHYEIYPSNTACTVYIPKYGLKWISINEGDDYLLGDVSVDQLDFIKYSNVTFGGIKIKSIETLNFSELGNNNPEEFSFRGTMVGNISAFENWTNLQNIWLMGENTFDGNLTSLGNLILLKGFICNSRNVVGAIEDLAVAQVTKGRTSGALQLSGTTTWTVNGQHVYSAVITFDPSAPNGYTITT